MVVLVALGIFLYLFMSLDMCPHHELAVKSFSAEVTTEDLLLWSLLNLFFIIIVLILVRCHRLGSGLGGPQGLRLLLLEVYHTLPLGPAGLPEAVPVAAPAAACGLGVGSLDLRLHFTLLRA